MKRETSKSDLTYGVILTQVVIGLFCIILILVAQIFRLSSKSYILTQIISPVLVDVSLVIIIGIFFEVFTKRQLFKIFATEMFETIYLKDESMGTLIKDETVEKFFKAAMASKLGSEKANALFANLIQPYFSPKGSKFRNTWRYEATLSTPTTDIHIDQNISLNKNDYYKLFVEYEFSEPEPGGIGLSGKREFSTIFVMDIGYLEEAFRAPECIFREVLFLTQKDRQLLIQNLRNGEKNSELMRAVARELLKVSVSVDGERIICEEDCMKYNPNLSSFRFTYSLPDRDYSLDTKFTIGLHTYITKEKTFLPIVISQPSRAPKIVFNYYATDINRVEYFDFFTGRTPFEPKVILDPNISEEYTKRIVFETKKDEWIFPSSGVVVLWWN